MAETIDRADVKGLELTHVAQAGEAVATRIPALEQPAGGAGSRRTCFLFPSCRNGKVRASSEAASRWDPTRPWEVR